LQKTSFIFQLFTDDAYEKYHRPKIINSVGPTGWVKQESELMLTRRAKAYSSSG